jgi:serine/threonine protein kinase
LKFFIYFQVMFLGACRVPPDIALVMEYCPRGTLHRLLHRSNVPLPLSLRIKMATHIARGMLALHSSLPRIIHRDLKTANLLVSASYEIKVCDFGLSRTMAHAAANCSNRSQSSFGTVEYAAPEVRLHLVLISLISIVCVCQRSSFAIIYFCAI